MTVPPGQPPSLTSGAHHALAGAPAAAGEAPTPDNGTTPVLISGHAVQNVVNSSVDTNVVVQHQVIAQILGRAGRAAVLRHEFSREVLQVMRRAYEAVPEHAEIRQRLDGPGAVLVLTATRRSGRRTAAVCALFDRDHNTPLIREIQVDDEVPLETHGEMIRRGENLLLDLGDAAIYDDLWRTTAQSLDAFSTVLARAGARMVVIAPCGWEPAALGWHGQTVRVSCPPPLNVLIRHLTVRNLSALTDRCAVSERIAQALPDTAPPQDAARLAELIDETAAYVGGDLLDTADDIIGGAVDAFADWANELREWFDEGAGTDPHARALITAVAAVEGSDRETILNARDLLLASFKRGLSDDDDFFGPSITTRIDRVGATSRHGQVMFTKPGYGPAVLHHIWSERGRSALTVLTWMIKLPRTHSLPTDVIDSLVDKLIVLADRHNDLRIIDTAVTLWTAEPAAGTEFFEKLLTGAALSTQIGSKARRKLYKIAGTNSPAGAVVAAVCGGELAQVYPDIALVRLRRLAQHRAPDVQAAVTEAMTRIARHHWPETLREAIRWAGQDTTRTVGMECLIELLHLSTADDGAGMGVPSVNRIDGESRADVVAAWSTLLTVQNSSPSVPDAMSRWLDVAFRFPEHRDHLLHILAEAGAASALRQASLREWAMRWSGVRHNSTHNDLEERIDLRERLIAMAEQMIAPLFPAPSTHGRDLSVGEAIV